MPPVLLMAAAPVPTGLVSTGLVSTGCGRHQRPGPSQKDAAVGEIPPGVEVTAGGEATAGAFADRARPSPGRPRAV